MNRRKRALAGLLALAAMTASFSEAVLASVCASPANMASMTDMAMSAEDGQHGRASSERGMPCDRMGDSGESRPGGEPCPLTPTATQGCTVAASAPAPGIFTLAADVSTPRRNTLDADEPELLLSRVLYHPPRA